jgi:hypothetical protein
MVTGSLDNNYTILFEFKYYLFLDGVKKSPSAEEGKKPPHVILYKIPVYALILQPLTCLKSSHRL